MKSSVYYQLKNYLFALIFPVLALIVQAIAFSYPEIVEVVYSRTVYPIITFVNGSVSRYLPFSFSEFALYVGALAVAATIVFALIQLIRRKNFLGFAKKICLLIVIAGCLFSAFTFNWSLNFARQPLATSMNLSTGAVSKSELFAATEVLIAQTNEVKKLTKADENGIYVLSKSKSEVMNGVPSQFNDYALGFMNLGIKTPVKPILAANLLSNLRIQGIFSPFSFEPNINEQMPALYFAASALHEYAHLKGFSREDECEFISYFVGSKSSDADFSYSTKVNALNHMLNAAYSADRERYREIYATIDDGVLGDMHANSAYWREFDTDVGRASETMNNNYLKSYRQEDGVKSYGRMVDLIVAMFMDMGMI